VAAPLLFFQSLLPYDPVAAQGGSADILWMRTPLMAFGIFVARLVKNTLLVEAARKAVDMGVGGANALSSQIAKKENKKED